MSAKDRSEVGGSAPDARQKALDDARLLDRQQQVLKAIAIQEEEERRKAKESQGNTADPETVPIQ